MKRISFFLACLLYLLFQTTDLWSYYGYFLTICQLCWFKRLKELKSREKEQRFSHLTGFLRPSETSRCNFFYHLGHLWSFFWFYSLVSRNVVFNCSWTKFITIIVNVLNFFMQIFGLIILRFSSRTLFDFSFDFFTHLFVIFEWSLLHSLRSKACR